MDKKENGVITTMMKRGYSHISDVKIEKFKRGFTEFFKTTLINERLNHIVLFATAFKDLKGSPIIIQMSCKNKNLLLTHELPKGYLDIRHIDNVLKKLSAANKGSSSLFAALVQDHYWIMCGTSSSSFSNEMMLILSGAIALTFHAQTVRGNE